MKSLYYIEALNVTKIIIEMVKKMLFLWVTKCGQEWPERGISIIQM